MYCRNCGRETAPGAEFCVGCGAKPAAGKSYCPNCGNQTSQLAEICVKCGVKLVAAPPPKAPAFPPGVIASYKWGWNKLWPGFWMLFLIGLVIGIIGNISAGLAVFALFITIPLNYGETYCFLRAARSEPFKFEDMFFGFTRYWNGIGAGLLSMLIIIGGLILLIVPGIIFACKLAFVPYLIVDRNLGATEAIKTSWKMTDGHAMQVFLIVLLGIPVIIAGFICLFVGVIVSSMWISIALASLYHSVSSLPENPVSQPL
jgi:uncharacterized membrane protein